MMSYCETECELNNLVDLPVAVIYNGKLLLSWNMPTVDLISQEQGTVYVTAGQVKCQILNTKQAPPPELLKMQESPDDCRLVFCMNTLRTIIPDGDRMADYGVKLSKTATLMVANSGTTMGDLLKAYH